MTHGKTYKKAVKQGLDAIESWIKVARELGRPVPPPRVRTHQTDLASIV
jgi:predicted RNase H-like HicB family nuclease